MVCTAAIADRIAAVSHGRWTQSSSVSLLHRLFAPRLRTFIQVILLAAAAATVAPGILEYLQTTHVSMHWSRAVLGSLLLVGAVMMAITGFLLQMMNYIDSTRDNTQDVAPPERIRPSDASTLKFVR